MAKTNLVNQNPGDDDIPFTAQNGDAGQGVPDNNKFELADLKEQLHRAHDMQNALAEEVKQKTKVIDTLQGAVKDREDRIKTLEEGISMLRQDYEGEPVESMDRACFLAILQGISTSGALSIGKVNSDDDTAKHMRHAAGLAKYAAAAAKQARIL